MIKNLHEDISVYTDQVADQLDIPLVCRAEAFRFALADGIQCGDVKTVADIRQRLILWKKRNLLKGVATEGKPMSETAFDHLCRAVELLTHALSELRINPQPIRVYEAVADARTELAAARKTIREQQNAAGIGYAEPPHAA